MKKLLICAAFCAFLSLPVFSQIRNYVGIVRGEFFPEYKTFLENIRDELKKNGSSTYAKYVDAYLESNGGFGSGFVYVAEDGTNYIITNRHVVSHAQSAGISFEDSETGEFTTYKNLTVAATDDDIDIAVLAFPDGDKPFKKGLTFSAKEVLDGSEVWSAGFPGLGGTPVWQLGKGFVTNSRVRLDVLLDSSISTLVQHSADVDSGNSGGPLLTVSSGATGGFEVAGINTWKATARQSANYAIPAKTIQNFLKQNLDASLKKDDKTKVSRRADKLISTLNDAGKSFTDIVPFISYAAALDRGETDFNSAMHFAPSSARSTILSAFSNSPLEGMRYAVAYAVWKKFSGSDTLYSIQELISAEQGFTSSFTGGTEESTVIADWTLEQGLWRLCSIEKKSEKDAKTSSKASSKASSKKNKKDGINFTLSDFDVSLPYSVRMYAGSAVNLDDSVNVGLGKKASGFGGLDFCFDFLSLGTAFEYAPVNDSATVFMNITPGIQVPLNFGSLIVVPLAKAGFGMNMLIFNTPYMTYFWSLGMELYFDLNLDVGTGLGVQYRKSTVHDLFADDESGDINYGALCIYVSIGL